MELAALAKVVRGQLFGNDIFFDRINLDSRTLKPGELFVAIRGETFDGHEFCSEAVQAGASALLAEWRNPALNVPQLIVENTTTALAAIARYHREQFNLKILAVTGSCGKTTVKEMTASILSEAGNTLASKGNFNNHIGLPLSLLNLEQQHEYAVFELGADHVGEIAKHVTLVQPTVAAITTIAPCHIEGFGSIENIAKAKSEIYQTLASHKGIAIAAADSPYLADWQQSHQDLTWLTFGLDEQADVFASDIKFDSTGFPTFSLNIKEMKATIPLPFAGLHNVKNATTAAAMTYAAGISIEKIKAGLEKASNVGGRLKIHKLHNGARIIDDTYNANPTAVKAAIDTLKQISTQSSILVLGDMAELGSKAISYHREMGTYAKQAGINTLYAIGKFANEIADAFGNTGQAFSSKAELIAALQPILKKDVVCLVKGSRSARMEEIVEAIKDKMITEETNDLLVDTAGTS